MSSTIFSIFMTCTGIRSLPEFSSKHTIGMHCLQMYGYTKQSLSAVLQRETTVLTYCLQLVMAPFQKGIYFQRKKISPLAANSFRKELIPFLEGKHKGICHSYFL